MCFENSKKIIEVWLGCLSPTTIYARLYTLDFIQSLQNSLNEKNFNTLLEIKTYLDKYLSEKPERFWKDGMRRLRNGETMWNRMVPILFNKRIPKYKWVAFQFYLKIGTNFSDIPKFPLIKRNLYMKFFKRSYYFRWWLLTPTVLGAY